MTGPLAGVTNPYAIQPGQPAVRITDGTNNSPAGLTLANRGDNGGTIWIMGGPAAQAAALPLGAGATLQWSDPVNLPYAYLAAGATAPETLVVSSQAGAYTNPTVVAAALIQQGIPSTMLDTGYGTFRIPVTLSAPALTVGQSASLLVAVDWPGTPAGLNAVRLRFDDPAVPDLPPLDLYCTNNNLIEQGQNKWQVPVLAPRLTITNLHTPDNNNQDAYVQVVGTNRPVDRFRIVGTGLGTKTLFANTPALGTNVVMQASAVDAIFGATVAGADPGTGPMTRFTGPVTVNLTVGNTSTGGGILSPAWVDESGRLNAPRLLTVGTNSGPDYSIQWNHPACPVWWRYDPITSIANNYARVTVSGSS